MVFLCLLCTKTIKYTFAYFDNINLVIWISIIQFLETRVVWNIGVLIYDKIYDKNKFEF